VEWIFLFPVAWCRGEKMTSNSHSAEHPTSPRPQRCAIYTRKSTEDGLNQPFNTLEAQREAAEAYILSQRHAGWSVVAERYDDGGYTGGNLDRPALQKLITDMEAGRVNCVVIYKVDRLSRSLLDFARLMDVFERHGVSLVSVTQPLNTTVSMGRLTLDILLSFAQFEREIISERTRDKMAAARKKGQWMGGVPVLGYDVATGGGRLVVNSEEAERVRAIFTLYLEYRSIEQVLAAVQTQGWRNKRRTAETETPNAGRPLSKAGFERLLSNVLYIGQVQHEGKTYQGEQASIIEESVWREAQKLLSNERSRRLFRGAGTGARTPPGGNAQQRAVAERADRQTDGSGAEVRADDSPGGRTGLCCTGRSGAGVTSAGDVDHESAEPGARYSGADSVLEMGNGRTLRNLLTVHPANELAAAVERPTSALGSFDIKDLRARVTATAINRSPSGWAGNPASYL